MLWNDAFSPVRFTQLIFAGEETTATTTTYASVRWRGPFAGVPESNQSMRVRICDFYRMARGDDGELRIAYNWMMLDVADFLRASGRRVLPKSASLPDEGWFQPPRAMDGVPAPLSAFTPPESREASRAIALRLLAAEWGWRGGAAEGVPAADGAAAAEWRMDWSSSRALWTDDMLFYGPSGVGFAQGYEQYADHVLAPLDAALAERRFELDVVACEGAFCGAHGFVVGKHVGCYLGQWPQKHVGGAEQAEGADDASIEQAGGLVRIRVGLHWHVVDGQVKDGYAFYDTPQLFANAWNIDLFERAMSSGELPPACPASPTLPGALVDSAERPSDPLRLLRPMWPTGLGYSMALVGGVAVFSVATLGVAATSAIRPRASPSTLAAPLLA